MDVSKDCLEVGHDPLLCIKNAVYVFFIVNCAQKLKCGVSKIIGFFDTIKAAADDFKARHAPGVSIEPG